MNYLKKPEKLFEFEPMFDLTTYYVVLNNTPIFSFFDHCTAPQYESILIIKNKYKDKNWLIVKASDFEDEIKGVSND